ncbi:MAG: ribosome maturation factor RimM [Oscillospiraceae bacterium]|nr:ribosome maturation factor RimM [Oscillospiraceae bacterium]
MKKKEFLEVGKIVTTHGLKGNVKIQPWCDESTILANQPRLFFDSKGEFCREIEDAMVYKNLVVVKFKGIDSIEFAQKLRNHIVYINRNDLSLDEGSYFIQDLIGLNVYDADVQGLCYGRVVEVLQSGANDVYRILDKNGKERLVPVIDDVVLKIDVDNDEIIIRPLEGLFDD